jgi:hypothetical protein
MSMTSSKPDSQQQQAFLLWIVSPSRPPAPFLHVVEELQVLFRPACAAGLSEEAIFARVAAVVAEPSATTNRLKHLAEPESPQVALLFHALGQRLVAWWLAALAAHKTPLLQRLPDANLL